MPLIHIVAFSRLCTFSLKLSLSFLALNTSTSDRPSPNELQSRAARKVYVGMEVVSPHSSPQHGPLGMGSMIWVVEMYKSSMNARFAYSSGTVPEICWFQSTFMILSIKRFPSSVGRLPVRAFLGSDNTSSFVQLPNSDGMLPSKFAFCRKKPTDWGK